MIGIYLDGRMGNHLFEYAFIVSAKKKLKTSFFLDQFGFNFILPKYFELPSYNRFYNSMITKLYYANIIKLKKLSFEGRNSPAEVIPQVGNNAYYTGYFQSLKYFKEYEGLIREEFKLQKAVAEQFDKKYGELYRKNKILAVHVRRTDYKQTGGEIMGGMDITLPEEYYKNALASIPDIDSYQLLFVSDDIEFCKTTFGKKPNYHFESNNEIVDFQIILNADAAILSNSSFAWWAGFLNTKPNKLLMVPEYWMAFKAKKEYPVDILADLNWKIISF